MARWVGVQGQVNSVKNAKTCPHYEVTHKNPKTKTKNIF